MTRSARGPPERRCRSRSSLSHLPSARWPEPTFLLALQNISLLLPHLFDCHSVCSPAWHHLVQFVWSTICCSPTLGTSVRKAILTVQGHSTISWLAFLLISHLWLGRCLARKPISSVCRLPLSPVLISSNRWRGAVSCPYPKLEMSSSQQRLVCCLVHTVTFPAGSQYILDQSFFLRYRIIRKKGIVAGAQQFCWVIALSVS